MNNGTGAFGAPTYNPDRFAETVEGWVDLHEGILAALVELRTLGDEAEAAVDVIMALPTVRRMRLGWELWEALVEGEGGDPEVLLLDHLAYDVIDHVREALWGIETPSPPTLRLIDCTEEEPY